MLSPVIGSYLTSVVIVCLGRIVDHVDKEWDENDFMEEFKISQEQAWKEIYTFASALSELKRQNLSSQQLFNTSQTFEY